MKLVTKRKDRVVGFVTWKRIGKTKHGLIELTRIEVHKKYRGKGIATELFKRMLKKIKFRKLFLTSHASNVVAHSFYIKMGMAYEATLYCHYYNWEDEDVYSMFRK